AINRKCSLYRFLKMDPSCKKQKKLRDFVTLIDKCHQMAHDKVDPPEEDKNEDDIIELDAVNGQEIYRKPKSNAKLHEQAIYVFNQAQIIDHYKKKHENERVDNIQELCNAMRQFSDLYQTNDLNDFLSHTTLDNSSQDGKIDSSRIDAVQLMTVHGSKGLEFHYVFIVGLNEGLFPSSFPDTDEEEERRLMYVAITRAKRVLHLTHSRRRMHFGEWKNCQRSKFLNEIPIDLIRQVYDPQLNFNSKNDATPSPHKKMKTTTTTTPMAFMSGSSLLKLNNNKKT
ncbi:unnamed protein product, partial [Didymodactylos carnosus]